MLDLLDTTLCSHAAAVPRTHGLQEPAEQAGTECGVSLQYRGLRPGPTSIARDPRNVLHASQLRAHLLVATL
jgi:hypothetical protein